MHTYNPKEVTVIYGGIILTGFGDGDFINVEREAGDWSDFAGVDGEVTRSRLNDPRLTITLTLSQASPGNRVLSDLRKADAETGNGAKDLLIRDLRGETLLYCSKAWIQNPPAISFAREAGTREWELRGIEAERVDGGLPVS